MARRSAVPLTLPPSPSQSDGPRPRTTSTPSKTRSPPPSATIPTPPSSAIASTSSPPPCDTASPHADAWRTFLAFESTTNEHALLLEAVVLDHAFRLGQLYPAASATEETTRDPILRRLARAATDMRSPPGQRLRVLIGAAMLAVEELYPPQSRAG